MSRRVGVVVLLACIVHAGECTSREVWPKVYPVMQMIRVKSLVVRACRPRRACCRAARTCGFAPRPAAAFLDLDVFPPAVLTTVVKPTKMPAWVAKP